MEQGQRVKWMPTGELGTVEWITKQGTFAVTWDIGGYVEYNVTMDDLIIRVVE